VYLQKVSRLSWLFLNLNTLKYTFKKCTL